LHDAEPYVTAHEPVARAAPVAWAAAARTGVVYFLLVFPVAY